MVKLFNQAVPVHGKKHTYNTYCLTLKSYGYVLEAAFALLESSPKSRLLIAGALPKAR